MSSDVIWTGIQPDKFINGPFLDNYPNLQAIKRQSQGKTISHRSLDSPRNLTWIGITNQDYVRCNFYSMVSEHIWNETYGYRTYKLSFANKKFRQKFLLILLREHNITFDDKKGELLWTNESQLTPVRFGLSPYRPFVH